MRRIGLTELAAFVAVAEQLSFRVAASRLDVSPSALSHTMRQLEERLGVRLLHRTTRSVALTDAGQRLLERLRPAIDQIDGALEDLDRARDRPSGRLRIHLTHSAVAAVTPVWARFLTAYPEVQLELEVDQAPVDLVAKGFDAGIGPRDHAAADMVAVRVTAPTRLAVVGAPAYFKRQPTPRTPDDLAQHCRVQYRWAHDGPVLEWPLARSKPQRAWVGRRVTVNNPYLAIRAALDGLGARLHLRGPGRAVPALGTAGPGAGGLVPVVRGVLSLLSRPAAGAGGAARLHRHDPRGQWPVTGREIAREPVRRTGPRVRRVERRAVNEPLVASRGDRSRRPVSHEPSASPDAGTTLSMSEA